MPETECRSRRSVPRAGLLVLAIMIGVLAPQALGQANTAAVFGRVTDPQGALVPNADVEIKNIDTNIVVASTTNAVGLYAFPNLPPGRYLINVRKQGFQSVTATGITLEVQDSVVRNFMLQVGATSESITVSASGMNVNTTDASVSTVIDQRLVRELPLNGRSFQTLFQVTPGAVITQTNLNNQGQFSVNGQRADANYFLVDGASANASIAPGFGGAQTIGGSLPALNAFGGTNNLVSTEAVQEFAIQTSTYAPEFGRTPGAQVSIVTRAGTNEMHGELFDYLRNDLFDANDWFANHNALRRAALRQNDFGGVVGGPLVHDRTFFFFSYEGLRLRQPTTGLSDVPTLAIRTSAPAAIQPLLNAYPQPTGADEGNGLAPAIYGFSNPSTLDAAAIRIDHHFSDSLFIFGRYNYSPSDTQIRGGGHSLNTVTDTANRLQTITFGLTHTMTQRLLNDVRFNWTENDGSSSFALDNFGGATSLSLQGFLPASCTQDTCLFDYFPSLSGQNIQLENGGNISNVQHQLNLLDNLSYQVGAHALKFGVDYRRLTPQFAPSRYSQFSAFSTMATALTLKPLVGQIQARVPVINVTYDNYSLYAQDTWQAGSRLALTFGLRWDYNPAPTGEGSNGLLPAGIIGISNPKQLSLAPTGSPLYRATVDNFAPRLGVAYRLRRSTETQTILRFGAGVFYDTGVGPAGTVFQSFPYISAKNVSGHAFPYNATDIAPPAIPQTAPFGPITGFPATLRLPYTYQWNLSVEQSFGRNQTLTASYVGAAGHSLLRESSFAGAVLPPIFSTVNYADNSGYSKYNALQGQVRRRVASGLDLTASYTFSHSLDNVSSDTNLGIPGQFLSPAIDYASSDFDIRHTGTVAADWNLPGGFSSRLLRALFADWSLDPLFVARSAPPVNVTFLRNIGFGTYSFRPDMNLGAPLYVDNSSLPGGRGLNVAAFSVPATQTQGDLSRNAARGFSLMQVDVALRRRFRLTERFALQARVEAFNVLNHPNFAPENGSLGTVTPAGQLIVQNGFGVSPSMLAQGLQTTGSGAGFSPLYQVGGPRSLQLGLKLEF